MRGIGIGIGGAAGFAGPRRAWRTRRIPSLARLLPFLSLSLSLVARVEAQTTHLVIISGLSGEERFARDFSAWTSQLARAAEERHGVPGANITVLSEAGAGAAKSTKENVAAALRRVGSQAGAADDVAIVLFGHGSASGPEGRINLPGPDLTTSELATLLDGLTVRRTIVVNTASASGAFLVPLAKPGRIIITATKSGMEQNETMFPRFFVAAFTGDGADADRDGRVSMLEAFTYAKREVERAYASDRRLLTEHAQLEADGDGKPDAEVVAARGDGAAARAVFLGASAATAAAAAPADASPELRALYEEKRRLEGELETLRERRESLPSAEYQQSLERLLLELSRNGQAIRRLEGGS